MNDKFFEELKEKIQIYFEEGGSHSFDHTQRVYNLALKISKGENADLDIVKTASLLHDIARLKQDNKEIECHAEHGAEMVREILEKTNFPKGKIEKVCYAIKSHRYSKGLKAETKEAEILQDADRLDALGAICIGRIFSYGGKKGRALYDSKIKPDVKYKSDAKTSLNHFYEKNLKIKPETFKTKKARKIAKGRYKFIEEFVKRFKLEWEGKE